MAINISTDINVTTGGKLTDVGQIQGGWKSVDSASDAYALTGSATTKGLLEDGQIFYVKSSEELLSVSITGNPPFQTYSFSSFSFPGSGGSGDITSVVAGAGLSGGASTGDATLTLDTSSVHFTNAVSASAATAGFGSGGNGGNYDGAISSSVQIANLGAEIISSSGQITSLNNVTLSGTSTIASADINGGTIDGVTIGGTLAGTATFSSVDINGGTLDNVTIGGTLAGTATFSSVDINGGTLDNVTIGGTLAGTANFSSVNIDGGTIDNTVIGGVIAASGRFTTGNFTNITASASITSSDVYIDGWGSVSESLASVNGGGGSNYDGAISSSGQIAALGAGILSGSISTFPYTGSAEITGSLRVDGRITAVGEDNVSTTQNNIVFPAKGFGMSADGFQHISFSKTVGQLSLRGKSSTGAGGSDGVGGVSIANNGGTKVFEYYDSGSSLQRIRMQTGVGGTDLQVEITGALGITGFPNVSASLAEALSGGASGDITGVTAGNGLSGGGLSGGVTLTLDTSSTHFTNAVNDLMGDSGIFTATGSVYSTTNDLEVTGSLTIADGLLKLKEYTTTPSAVAGAIFYSASALYFGVD